MAATDGWHHFGVGDVGVHVRFGLDGEQIVMTEIYVNAERGVSPTELRNVPWGRFEAIGRALGAITRREIEASAGSKEPTLAQLRAGKDAAATARPARRKPLGRPDGSNPDDFYARVAERYRELVKETRAPAPILARESQTTVAAAHRWIREARRRGFLPAGQKGKSG
jgi:hypothetical protein